MPVQLGSQGQPGFDQPIELMTDCHRRIEQFLGMLERVAGHQQPGPLDDQSQRAVRAAIRYFREAAPNHTADEEESLFPRLRQVDGTALTSILDRADRLELEHRHAEQVHARVEAVYERWLDDGMIAPKVLDALQRDLHDLRELYREHIAFEDDVLFPAAKKTLTDRDMSKIGQEMEQRRQHAPRVV